MKTSDSRIKEQHHLISPRHAHEKMSRPLRRRDGVNEYARGNNPQIIVRKVRKYYYFCNVSASTGWSGHIDESVFALSFQENVVVFNEYKDKPTAPFICIRLRVFNTQRYRCGDCFRLFILRFYHNLLEDKRRNGSTLSFVIIPHKEPRGIYRAFYVTCS